mgnify:CR=1 FL=1
MIDYNKVLCPAIKEMKPSGIRKFFDIAQQLEGVISLGVGEPDFKTPWLIRQEAISTLEKGKTCYTANAGLIALREEIAKYFQRTIHTSYDPNKEIIVTVGGSEAIDLTIRCLIQPGDEVLIVEPSFVCYRPIVSLCGGVPVVIETKEENEFRLTADELREKITDKTKLLVLPYPNNPTGAIMRREDLEAIAKVLKDTNIMIASDEIYSELTYSGKHCSIAEIEGMRERTIVINGFSKSFAMTGWRLGFLGGPKEIVSQMLKLHQYAIMCAPTNSQFAAVEALKNCDMEVEKMVTAYDQRRRYLVHELREMGIDCFEPFGAFYIFPSIKKFGMTSEEFANRLLEDQKLAVVPGTAFGESGEGFVRISYAYSLDSLKEGLRRIKNFINKL